MKTFNQFVEDLAFHFNIPTEIIKEYPCKNWTTRENCGWTHNLYELEYKWFVIEYTQERNMNGLEFKWYYRFNGTRTVGEGLTLEEAEQDLKEKQKRKWYYHFK